MFSLLRRPTARPGRSRGRVVLRLEGFEIRAQPSDPTGSDSLPISTTSDYWEMPGNQAPKIEVWCSEIAIGQFRIHGRVWDESPGGLTVRFDGIPSAIGKSCVTNADGTFSMILYVQTDGSDIGFVSAKTTDREGLVSNLAWDDIHPTPPPGG